MSNTDIKPESTDSDQMESSIDSVIVTIGGVTYSGFLTKQAEGSQRKNNQKNAQQEGGKRMKKMKASKAKGTRKLSPYMKFAQQARKEILAENPSLKSDIIAVGKKIGEKWRALSDAEKAKY